MKSPNYYFEKGMLECSKGADKTEVVLPLFQKAYPGLKNDADFLYVFGTLLFDLQQYTMALGILGESVRIKPNNAAALLTVAMIFERAANPVSVINTCKMVLNLEPRNSRAYNIMANSLIRCGFQQESFEARKNALEYCCDANAFMPASEYLFNLNYTEKSREEIFALHDKHRLFWESEPLPARAQFPQTEKIKIGFVTADLRKHAVAFFMKALFECYDREKFEFHCFSFTSSPDGITEKFIKLSSKWHDVHKLQIDEIVKIIRGEQISVLVDLSGHTAAWQLKIYGHRPAPVQVAYCGYPNTTGFRSIDYRITDDICEPSDAQNFHSEKLYKIDDCFLCFSPNDDFPETHFEPFGKRPIIFGSFNNLSKMTPQTIKLWCKVVNSVPNGKFAIKNVYLGDPKLRDLIISRFIRNGLSEEQIVNIPSNMDAKEHYEQYNKIDIALDSFPYNGTTTTCEALYMGVPVITILGDRHVSRVSASLLTTVGLPELIAKDENEFVRIAAELAQNTTRLAEIKRSLRTKMQNSPLTDKKAFTQKFQNAIVEMINEIKARD